MEQTLAKPAVARRTFVGNVCAGRATCEHCDREFLIETTCRGRCHNEGVRQPTLVWTDHLDGDIFDNCSRYSFIGAAVEWSRWADHYVSLRIPTLRRRLGRAPLDDKSFSSDHHDGQSRNLELREELLHIGEPKLPFDETRVLKVRIEKAVACGSFPSLFCSAPSRKQYSEQDGLIPNLSIVHRRHNMTSTTFEAAPSTLRAR